MKLQAKVKYIECIPIEDFNDYQKVLNFLGDKLLNYNIIYKKNILSDVVIHYEQAQGFNPGIHCITWEKGYLLVKEKDGELHQTSRKWIELNYDIIEE